jgi:hypothetical protein
MLSRTVHFLLTDLEYVFHRSCLHMDSGLEFFLVSKRSYFVFFPKGDRKSVLSILKRLQLPNLKLLQTAAAKDYAGPFTDKWRHGQLSNYEYLMFVNFLGGRSFSDLSQYPVFPWVLTNFVSDSLDLSDAQNFRDLSKPIGMINSARFDALLANYTECPDGIPDKCLYRMHYSNAFYVLHFLVRVEPFTTLHIEVNDRKFDTASRAFISVQRSWEAVNSRNPDFRELIPEFFSFPDFLVNDNGFDLGLCDNAPVADAGLPPWAHGSAHEFIDIHRQALESPHVSAHLCEWVDLIFGASASGAGAVRANNTFHRYCYASALTREVLANPDTLKTVQGQASNVGIIPRQVFAAPHPKRIVAPARPSFARAALAPLVRLTGTRFAQFARGALWCLAGDCELSAIALGRRPDVRSMGSVADFASLPPAESAAKAFALLPDAARFIASSTWDNSFHVFKADGGPLAHLTSVRQRFSLLSAITPAGGALVLASWRDSSLTLWDLAEGRPQRPLYRKMPHIASLVDVDVSPQLGIIASLDKARKCILSRIDTGAFVREFVIEGEELLERVMVFAAGYCAVQASGAGGALRLFGINARKIAERRFTEEVVGWCRCEWECALSAAAIAFAGGAVRIVRMPDLEVVCEVRALEDAQALAFSPQGNCLAVAGKTEVALLSFEEE